MEIGETVKIEASVKTHEEYKGIKQTVITRAKLWVSPEEKKAAAKARKAEKDAQWQEHEDNIANNPDFYNAYSPNFGKKL